MASGMLSEIGNISAFHPSDALAKYAGLYWLKNESGDFTSEDNAVSKAGTPYLRYHLGELLTTSEGVCLNTRITMQKIC